jgi:hypothetical protein
MHHMGRDCLLSYDYHVTIQKVFFYVSQVLGSRVNHINILGRGNQPSRFISRPKASRGSTYNFEYEWISSVGLPQNLILSTSHSRCGCGYVIHAPDGSRNFLYDWVVSKASLGLAKGINYATYFHDIYTRKDTN